MNDITTLVAIPITVETKHEISEALDAEQGRRRAAILTAAEVIGFAKRAENSLETLGLPESYREGATYRYSQRGPAALAYGASRATTEVLLRRSATEWLLIELKTVKKYPRKKETNDLHLTEMQQEYLANK